MALPTLRRRLSPDQLLAAFTIIHPSRREFTFVPRGQKDQTSPPTLAGAAQCDGLRPDAV